MMSPSLLIPCPPSSCPRALARPEKPNLVNFLPPLRHAGQRLFLQPLSLLESSPPGLVDVNLDGLPHAATQLRGGQGVHLGAFFSVLLDEGPGTGVGRLYRQGDQ